MRNFATSFITPYQGAFGAQAITAHQKSSGPPQGVSLTIPWAQYALAMNIAGGVTTFNGGVSIDISRRAVTAPLDIVKSVFIDNTAVDRPVYLRCEDTGQVVTCADFSYGYYPLITNGEQFTLFTDNIIPLRDGKEVTRLIFSNASFDTFQGTENNQSIPLYASTGLNQRRNPVLGDTRYVLKKSYASNVSVNVNDDVEALPAVANSYYVITGIYLNNYGQTDQAGATVNWTNSLRQSTGKYLFRSTFQIVNYNNANIPNTNRGVVLQQTGLQVVCDIGASLIYNMTQPANQSSVDNIEFILDYTRIDLPALS